MYTIFSVYRKNHLPIYAIAVVVIILHLKLTSIEVFLALLTFLCLTHAELAVKYHVEMPLVLLYAVLHKVCRYPSGWSGF